MGYEIHIRRDDESEIGLDEWRAAVAAIDGMRLASGDAFARNPRTNAKIRIPTQGGDVEVFFPECDAWVRCLSWSHGRISFRPPVDFANPTCWFRWALAALATQLGARLVGDDGEVYD
jgi:hypothetical protein